MALQSKQDKVPEAPLVNF